MSQILPTLISRQVCSYDVPAYAGTEGRECCREIRQCVPRKGKPLNPASWLVSPRHVADWIHCVSLPSAAAAGFCSQPCCALDRTLGVYAGRAVFVHACIEESLWPGPWRLPAARVTQHTVMGTLGQHNNWHRGGPVGAAQHPLITTTRWSQG